MRDGDISLLVVGEKNSIGGKFNLIEITVISLHLYDNFFCVLLSQI